MKEKAKSQSPIPIESLNCVDCDFRSICPALEVGARETESKACAAGKPERICKLKYRSGDYMFRISNPFSALYMLVAGRAKMCWLDETGEEQSVAEYLPGDLIGLDAINSKIHASSALAVGHCVACKIPCCPINRKLSVALRLKVKVRRQLGEALRAELLSRKKFRA